MFFLFFLKFYYIKSVIKNDTNDIYDLWMYVYDLWIESKIVEIYNN